MAQHNFRKPFDFHNFSEIFYCGMTRLRNMNLSVIIQCHYVRNILRNKNMGQSLFRKHLKFQNFDEIFYQTQKDEFGCFCTTSVHKNFLKKQKYGTESVYKTFKNSNV